MKKIAGIVISAVIITGMISCTDVQSDGINTVIWEGSVVPEDSSYRNPVWEPDLSFPSVFKAAVGYYALGSENEWSPGLSYTAPVLSSNDLMNWRFRGEAFVQKPGWSTEKINSLSAGFAKTRGTYYLFYTLGNEGIGMGGSKAPQGPYTDFGRLINSGTLGLSETTRPFFFTFGAKAYIFFKGGDGIYGQEILLNRDKLADLRGEKFKVTGSHITGINIIKIGDHYYLFGAVEDGNNSNIVIGRSLDVTQNFLDKEGESLLEGGGTMVLRGNPEKGFVAVSHPGGIFEDANKDIWVLYQASDIDKPNLSSGTARHPLLLSRIAFDENGWPDKIYEATGGWNYPKFAK